MLFFRQLGFGLIYLALAVLIVCYGLTWLAHMFIASIIWHGGTYLGIAGLVCVGIYFITRMFGASQPYGHH